MKHQVLLGVTGSGKTFTIANVIYNVNRPTLVIAHNKTLAAQLYSEFKELFREEIESKKVYVRDCQIDTDLEMMIPEHYVESTEERLKLYTELDSITDEEALEKFKARLIDRFGPLPHTVHELFNALRLRWLALQLGFERIILKKRKLRCYFTQNQDSPFYDSPVFSLIMGYVQKQGNRCTIKQSPTHLILIYEGIKNVTQARTVLNELVHSIAE